MSVAHEVAESEFNRFLDLMDIEIDLDKMGEDDKKSFTQQKEKVVNAIASGALTINDNGEPTYTPQRAKDAAPITFYEPTGASLMAMDRKQKAEDVAKLYAAMADMTKTTPATFSKMKMADLKVCMAVATLFLA